jgi:Zn-dependent protease
VGGIDVRVHATFLLLLVWVAISAYQRTGSGIGATRGVAFVLALFASVVLHEFGHALVARRYGIGTRDITLLPIGGVARLERMPDRPREELWIALAGPTVTLALAVILYVAAQLAGLPMSSGAAMTGSVVTQLMWANVSLLVFNLLPAFPMDGGRVLRAALAMRMSYARATAVAARVGRAFALVFGIIGLFGNPLLVFIALFVWLAAAAEAQAVQMRSMLGDVPVERVMIRDVQTLNPRDPLTTALDHILRGFQQDFPVVEDHKVVGVLSRDALLRAVARQGRDAPVADAMDRAFRTAEPGEPVEQALARLRECRCHTMPVVSNGQLQGVLTMENIGEFVMIQTALQPKQ